MISELLETKDVLIYEDEKICRKLIKTILKQTYDVNSIESFDNIFTLPTDIRLYRPKIVIADYNFPNQLNLNYVLQSLEKFRHHVVIYSCDDKKTVSKAVEKELGCIPKNFKIFSKTRPAELYRFLDEVLAS